MSEINEAAAVDWNLGEDTDRQDDPLLDCLITLTKLHGRSATRTGLSAGLPLVQNRLTVELFSRAADRADLASRIVKRFLHKIANLQLPAVLLLNDREACVLVEKIEGGKESCLQSSRYFFFIFASASWTYFWISFITAGRFSRVRASL